MREDVEKARAGGQERRHALLLEARAALPHLTWTRSTILPALCAVDALAARGGALVAERMDDGTAALDWIGAMPNGSLTGLTIRAYAPTLAEAVPLLLARIEALELVEVQALSSFIAMARNRIAQIGEAQAGMLETLGPAAEGIKVRRVSNASLRQLLVAAAREI